MIGAAATLQDAFGALLKSWPELKTFAARFAGLPVRNSGTLGGNIANGSPIGDSMPLLIALKSRLVLASVRGEREMPLEDFYTGYRQNLLATDEVVAFIKVPLPASAVSSSTTTLLRAYKISKRIDEDISSVLAAFRFDIAQGRIGAARMAYGGMAGTPARAFNAEGFIIGARLGDEATWAGALGALALDFQPLTDQRASAQYRSLVARNLLKKALLEMQGADLSTTRVAPPRESAHV